ncbi:MAG: PAS domain-containing protein [Kiloniellales bacterium]|nr:PAS domain-containing protein [Kiloniellales bacterium]
MDQGLRYWQERRRDRNMPSRADIDPLDIPDLLPQVFLVNVSREPLEFRYRLLGTQIVRHSAADYTGKSLQDLPKQCPPSRIWSLFQRVVEERRPFSAQVPYVYIPGKFVEMLAAPLSDDAMHVNMIFGIAQFDPSLALPKMMLPNRNQVAF